MQRPHSAGRLDERDPAGGGRGSDPLLGLPQQPSARGRAVPPSPPRGQAAGAAKRLKAAQQGGLASASGVSAGGLSVASSAPSLGPTKAFKGLYDALDEEAWLDTKFLRSGAPQPKEGELTVVVEFCFNSGTVGAPQTSTKHSEERYHREAMLVRNFFVGHEDYVGYYPATVVKFISSDFRARGREPCRLGAFEVDARMRIDGRIATYNLWSKLHTKSWTLWPEFGDRVRELVPVFQLNIRCG